MKRSLVSMLAVALWIGPRLSSAGSFSVSPPRVHLSADQRTAIVSVANVGNEKAVVQVGAYVWGQDENGADSYQRSNDLVIFPKIVTIERGEEKTVRIGYPGPAIVDRERTMRLFFEELPISGPGEPAVRMALKFGVPVFLEPKKVSAGGRIDSVGLVDGAIAVRFRNDGNTHLFVKEVAIVGEDSTGARSFSRQQAGWYVLAGATRAFLVPVDPQECAMTWAVRAAVELEGARPPRRLEARVEIPRSSGDGKTNPILTSTSGR
jgi:fimbrial chaperone protein